MDLQEVVSAIKNDSSLMEQLKGPKGDVGPEGVANFSLLQKMGPCHIFIGGHDSIEKSEGNFLKSVEDITPYLQQSPQNDCRHLVIEFLASSRSSNGLNLNMHLPSSPHPHLPSFEQNRLSRIVLRGDRLSVSGNFSSFRELDVIVEANQFRTTGLRGFRGLDLSRVSLWEVQKQERSNDEVHIDVQMKGGPRYIMSEGGVDSSPTRKLRFSYNSGIHHCLGGYILDSMNQKRFLVNSKVIFMDFSGVECPVTIRNSNLMHSYIISRGELNIENSRLADILNQDQLYSLTLRNSSLGGLKGSLSSYGKHVECYHSQIGSRSFSIQIDSEANFRAHFCQLGNQSIISYP